MSRAVISQLASALRTARKLLQEKYDSMLHSACPKKEDGAPDVSRIDPDYRVLANRYKRTLGKIDKALQ